MTQDIDIIITPEELDLFFAKCPELAERFQEALLELQESGEDVSLMMEADDDGTQ